RLAYEASVLLLAQLQKNTATWAIPRLTSKTTYWHGIVDWPRPDGAFEDSSTGASCAIEFKPPGQPKREYLTGIGQSLAYLESFAFALLIMPSVSWDGYEIGAHVRRMLTQEIFSDVPLVLLT